MAGSPAITPSPFRGSGVICILSYLRPQYVTCCCDVGVEAYMIVGGELREPLRNPVLEVTTRSLYSSIDAVGKDLKFFAGYCGKGDPMQSIPVWMGGPHVRLKKVRLGSTPPRSD